VANVARLPEQFKCGRYELHMASGIVESHAIIIMRMTVVAEPDNRRDKGERDGNFCKSSHDALPFARRR